MPKRVVSTEPSSQPLTRFTAQSRRDRRGELRRLSIPAASPRSQPTDTAPRHTDALRELVPDRVESLKKPPPAIAPLVGGPEPRRQACTLAEAPPTLCRRRSCRRPFIPRAAGSRQVFCSKGCRSAFHGEARQLGYRMVNAQVSVPTGEIRHATRRRLVSGVPASTSPPDAGFTYPSSAPATLLDTSRRTSTARRRPRRAIRQSPHNDHVVRPKPRR